MGKRLICAEDAINALENLFVKQIKRFDYESYEKADEKTQLVCDGISESIGCLLDLPSAQPERTGRWISFDSDSERYDDIKCSSCGKRFTVDADRYCDIGFIVGDLNYCPNCGAKMEVEHE